MADLNDVDPAVVVKFLTHLNHIAAAELKKFGHFTVPNLIHVKRSTLPAAKPGKRMAFGKVIKVKARPSLTVLRIKAHRSVNNQV